MAMLLLALTVMLGAALAAGAVSALLTRRWLRLALTAAGGAALVAAYGTALLATSLLSRETVLPAGEPKYFCGFYFDCHLGAAVAAARPLAGAPGEGTLAVDLRLVSTARGAALTPGVLDIVVLDAQGRRYERQRAAEQHLADVTGRPAPDNVLRQPVPAGGAVTTTVVFDLPADVRQPRLLVREGDGIQRLVERVLIGDDDALLRKPVLLALPAAAVPAT